MKPIVYFIVCFLITVIHSCKCKDRYDCPSLSTGELALLNYTSADTIKFINAVGQFLIFPFENTSVSQPYSAQACKQADIGCSCDYTCESTGSALFIGDSTRNGTRSLSYDIKETGRSFGEYSASSLVFTFDVFDFSGKINLIDSLLLFPGDSLASSISLGNHTYSNVHVVAYDTSQVYFQNKKIWKVYFTKTDGIIGFWDRQTQTVFYRP